MQIMELPPTQIHVARFSSDRCREIEAALIASGYLDLKPSKLELGYPFGGHWRIETGSDRGVIAVSARSAEDAHWVLTIQPSPPLLPRVVYRKSPPQAQMKQFEQTCYEVAWVLHEALQPLCPELQWELQTEAGGRTISDAPIPPTFRG